MVTPRPFRLARRLAADRRGLSAVEFSLLLPLMLLIYAGSVEISEVLTVDRKVNQLASTVGDLVAQKGTMDATEMNNIFAAGTAVMTPYPAAGVRIVVAAVDIVSDTTQTVSWGRALNDAAPGSGSPSPVPIPAAVADVGSQVVVSRVQYDFTSPFSDFMSNVTGRDSYTFEHVFIMRPRLGEEITWEN